MSLTEFFACMAVGAYIVLLGILVLFNRLIMTNNSTAGRGPTMEELADAVRKAQEHVDTVFLNRAYTPAHGLLGVSATATQEEIKAAYRQLRSQHHPDRGGDADTFHKIQMAYEQLMKPTRCPQCEGKGTIRVKRGAFIDKVQCPRCWPTKEGEK